MTTDGQPTGLVTTVDGAPHLIGAKCANCSTTTFPAQASCSRCGGEMSPTALPSNGSVWSCTVQRIEPKPPYLATGDWEPFALAYVDLGLVKVESRLSGKAVDSWQIGEPVTLEPGPPDEDGAVWRFRFVPDTTAADPADHVGASS